MRTKIKYVYKIWFDCFDDTVLKKSKIKSMENILGPNEANELIGIINRSYGLGL